MRLVCFAIFAAVALFAAVAMRAPAKSPELPLAQSSATKQPAWRLFTPCPIDRRDVPFLKPEERT